MYWNWSKNSNLIHTWIIICGCKRAKIFWKKREIWLIMPSMSSLLTVAEIRKTSKVKTKQKVVQNCLALPGVALHLHCVLHRKPTFTYFSWQVYLYLNLWSTDVLLLNLLLPFWSSNFFNWHIFRSQIFRSQIEVKINPEK